MKTIEIKIYNFSELNEDAKQTAKSSFGYCDFWYQDRIRSYKAAKALYADLETREEISGLRLYAFIQNNILPQLKKRIKYYKTEAGTISKYATSKINDPHRERFSRIQYSEDSENLTGYCADYDFLKPIFDFLKNPDKHTTNTDLMETDLIAIFERLSEEDYEGFYEDNNFSEHCDINGYQFTEDGKMF